MLLLNQFRNSTTKKMGTFLELRLTFPILFFNTKNIEVITLPRMLIEPLKLKFLTESYSDLRLLQVTFV